MIADIRARVAAIEARFQGPPTMPATPPAANRAPTRVGGTGATLGSFGLDTRSTHGTLGAMWNRSLEEAGWPQTSPPSSGSGRVPDGAAAYQRHFEAAGARYGIDPALLTAVAWTESNFDPTAVSHAGALGLMQIMPGTADGLGVDPLDPVQAIDGAARYLRSQLDRFGRTDLALAAYNAGPGAVQRHGGIPPYDETVKYVARVLDRLQIVNGQ